MPLNHLIVQGDNNDITRERERANFSTEALAAEIYGEKLAKRRREISAQAARTSNLLDPIPVEFLSREERIENMLRKTVAVIEQAGDIVDPSDVGEMGHLVNDLFGDDGFCFALHFIMFMPAISGQGDDEQIEHWMPRAMNLEIIGTYAQTEIGHGTYLRALGTTATYDKRTQEFVLHTPSVSAIKWWPGCLGKNANYAIVNALLLIDGKNYGPHNFIVQLRHEETHLVMPGITLGDIGPKFGANTNDNGFLKFDNVRIPRRQMLMRHSKVSPEGVYTPPVHPKLSYGAMIHVRAKMIHMQVHSLFKAATIAIRYSSVRRQGEIKQGAGEVQILDYQTQQHRLFPALARCYAYRFTGSEIGSLYEKIAKEVKDGNAEQLADLHALLSGMKAVVTFQSGKDIEQCRMSCGGHGYSHASGLPEIYATQIAGCTYEGENMVMLLQQARYLIKAAKAYRKGELLSTTVEYLRNANNLKCNVDQKNGNFEQSLIDALEFVARSTVLRAADRLAALETKGLSREDAWNANAVELTRASRSHTRLWIARCFRDRVQRIRDRAVQRAITDLLHLYLVYELIDVSQYMYQEDYATVEHIDFLKETMYELLQKIRPNAVSLVDAYEVSDNELRSVLGRRDGNVYENLMAWAQKNPLNKVDVLPAYEKYLRPMLHRNKSKI